MFPLSGGGKGVEGLILSPLIGEGDKEGLGDFNLDAYL